MGQNEKRKSPGCLGVVGGLFVIVVVLGVIGSLAGGGKPAAPLTPAEAAAKAAESLRANPEQALDLDIKWRSGGFNTVMILSGRLTSRADFAVKDPMIRCTLSGPSGTQVGRVVQTLYRVVPAKGSIRFKELNMGFMGSSQAASASCAVIGATALG